MQFFNVLLCFINLFLTFFRCNFNRFIIRCYDILNQTNDIFIINFGTAVCHKFIIFIDRLGPSFENPHEAHMVEEMDKQPRNPKLMRMGMMTALAIGIHNFPEGIATFTPVNNMALGVAIAVAIAIHNIPEGIAVSIPIFYATGDRKKAFKLSLLSGLAEPVGALLAYLVLMPFMSPTLMGCILAGVAGIMVFISIDELLPAAREYGEAHISIYGVVAGMALMAVSLILLA